MIGYALFFAMLKRRAGKGFFGVRVFLKEKFSIFLSKIRALR